MRLRILGFVAVMLCAVQPMAFGADISVPPGDGTLAAAVASAADGDTLVLGEGAFGGTVTVNKSLTIRPVNRGTDAIVTGAMTIEGSGLFVSVQGLKFGTTLKVNAGASIRILENDFTRGGIDVSAYSSAEGDGSLLVIGNRIAQGNISIVRSHDAYVLGNALSEGNGTDLRKR